MVNLMLSAWDQAKLGNLDPAFNLECAAGDLCAALALRRFDILRHFMTHPTATLEERAFFLGCPIERLQQEIERLQAAGFLEVGLFGIMASDCTSRLKAEASHFTSGSG